MHVYVRRGRHTQGLHKLPIWWPGCTLYILHICAHRGDHKESWKNSICSIRRQKALFWGSHTPSKVKIGLGFHTNPNKGTRGKCGEGTRVSQRYPEGQAPISLPMASNGPPVGLTRCRDRPGLWKTRHMGQRLLFTGHSPVSSQVCCQQYPRHQGHITTLSIW